MLLGIQCCNCYKALTLANGVSTTGSACIYPQHFFSLDHWKGATLPSKPRQKFRTLTKGELK